MVVRYAYIDNNNRVFWETAYNALLHFHLRPELGNAGVVRLVDYNPEIIEKLFENCRKSNIDINWQPSKSEINFYKLSINAMETVFYNRE